MYNQSNFIVSLNTGSLIDLVTGGIASLEFNIRNSDSVSTLYNLSFQLTLPDGLNYIDSIIPCTSVNENIYSFTNIKDLAPNEIDYKFTIDVKLKTTTSDGNIIPFGTLLPCIFKASADTMPRGDYDNINEKVESSLPFLFKASKYTIYKINPSKLLLGKTYKSKLIIKTAENSSMVFDTIQDILGNGINYLGDVSISGYSALQLNNFQVTAPDTNNNSFKLSWTNVLIPQNTTVEIQYGVKANERYYLNGTETGAYIQNAKSIVNQLSWKSDNFSLSNNYAFAAYEVILEIVLSKYVVDINETINYSINFYANLYHDLISLSGYLTTTDGQILGNTSVPMYTSKDVSENGTTQITWNVGTISKGTSTVVTIGGTIGSQYTSNGMNILAGDTFNVSATCSSISAVTNNIISSSDGSNFRIGVPSVSKVITGYYYRDGTSKPYNTLAPGDYLSYKSTYDSSNVKAPASLVKIFDFYPYITNDITAINYKYSSQQYPGSNALQINPYGNFWFVNSIPGNQSFDIDYKTQIDYVNSSHVYLNNLFKLQVTNSNGISYSNRSQVELFLGKPNLILNKSAQGNNINKIKIGEIYILTVTLTNDNSNGNATDAFNITFTETIPNNVNLNYSSVIAKINGTAITSQIQGNTVVVNIEKLSPNDIFTLSYNITINDTLGPNESFRFISSSTAPYTQAYDANNTNLQYDIGGLTKEFRLNSEDILLSLSSDKTSKIVGQSVEYTFNITLPMGQKILSLMALILRQATQIFSNEAWLNDKPINTNIANGRIVFPTVNNIYTTLSPAVYSYKIRCLIDDSIVSKQNPTYTIENYYGSMNYTDMLNISGSLGENSLITVNHPYVNLNITSSSVMNGFVSAYRVGANNIVYSKVTVSNSGTTKSINISANINIPQYLNLNMVETASSGGSYVYDSDIRVLKITVDSIEAASNKYVIFKSSIQNGKQAESKLIITGHVNHYYNTISTKKIYTSDVINNNELYLNSIMSFLPLKFYSLIGSDAAINLSKVGEATQIQYIITNLGQGSDSYKIEMTPIIFDYDIYIGSTFIQTVSSNTSGIITSTLLNNVSTGDSRYITFKYTIPAGLSGSVYETMLVKVTSLNNAKITKTIPTTLQDP